MNVLEEVEKTMSKIVEYHPNKRIPELDNTTPLADLVGKELVITDVRFMETSKFVVAIVTLSDGNKYRTVSNVLVKQLKEIKKMTDEGNHVKAKLTKRGRYLTFA